MLSNPGSPASASVFGTLENTPSVILLAALFTGIMLMDPTWPSSVLSDLLCLIDIALLASVQKGS